MISQHGNRRCIFTVDQANATLPLVRVIVSDLVHLAHDVCERSERMAFLFAGRGPFDNDDPYTEELAQVGDQLERDLRRLQEYADELLDLGVEPRSAVEGLVDFPTVLDGRIVYLCWKLGEPEILYWHELDGDYSSRRQLDECVTRIREVVAAG